MNYDTLNKYQTVKEKKSHMVKQLLVVTSICTVVSIILLIILELLVALFISFAFTVFAFVFYISIWYPVHTRKCPRCNSHEKKSIEGKLMYEYKEAISILIDNFPELRKFYEENIDDYKELPYVFYESVFFKFIMNMAYSYDEEKLQAIFSFIEDMLENGDKEIKNLIEVAIIESLYYEEDSKTKELLPKYFGPLTKESFENYYLK